MENGEIVVIGAGAAGLTAAICAARQGAKVTVLEHNERAGRKLCATGNGKCNLTNTSQYQQAYRGTHPEFAQPALKAYGVLDTIRFFSQLGIYTKNKNGYLYPHSEQASSVTEVLLMEAENQRVKIKTREHVKEIRRNGSGFQVVTHTWSYPAAKVILAAGSGASSIAGADGSGYDLARGLGHKIIKPLPALVALRCKGRGISKWAGVRTEGAVTLCLDNMPMITEKGELQLTEYGISGIPVYQISRYAVRALDEHTPVTVLLNFLPEFTKEELAGFLDSRRKTCPYKSEKEMLVGLFPEKLISVLTQQPDLVSAIYGFPLEVTGSLSMEHAQVCQGGVDTREVNPKTMESLLVPGLYFAGEILDIDGTCGGYNLQWAWSSAMAAGNACAKEEL